MTWNQADGTSLHHVESVRITKQCQFYWDIIVNRVGRIIALSILIIILSSSTSSSSSPSLTKKYEMDTVSISILW